MQSILARQRTFAPSNVHAVTCAVVLSLTTLGLGVSPASALVPAAGSSLQHQLKQHDLITNVVVRRGAAIRPGAMRPGVMRPGRWVRPPHYWWRPGGAIAAGAALGFLLAATAAPWAGSPPAPGYCWYYTDPNGIQGFWDLCP